MDERKRRVSIVTGAGGMRGIGRAVALRFARDGLDIALLDIKRPPSMLPEAEIAAGWHGIESVKEEIVALGQRAVCIYADISDAQQIALACTRTVAELGAIDVLVNNARALAGPDRVPVVDLDPAEWDRVMTVNARGAFLFSQAVARHLIERDAPGCIINMSSGAGKRGLPRAAAYSASKFAIHGLTQSLARELGPHGITVNAICPGVVDTGRLNLGEVAAAKAAGVTMEEFARTRFERLSKGIPLGKVATADDVAGVAAFLISGDAGHITGQALNVDGGDKSY